MSAWYNEIDKDAAAWLRELIAEGHIAPGIVDERSIEDVRPDELAGFTQCHFFAGVGIWSLALRASGIPDDYRIWTGSCPCQPFSSAGTGAGESDKRHLWPAFARLIEARRPPVVLGEQVASQLITGKRVSSHLQRLWERKARLGVLADWLEKDLSVALQSMPQQSGARTASNAQGFNIKSGLPIGGRGQIPSGHEGITVRSDCIVGAESARLWSMRCHWDSIRHGDEEGMEYSFSGSDASREGLHAPEHAGGLVRLERGLWDLGGEQGDRDGQCHHETPERAIQRASKATDRELEKEDGGAWIDTLQLDLEGMDYSFCCIPFPTAGVGGPHIRDRLYWGAFSAGVTLGDTGSKGLQGLGGHGDNGHQPGWLDALTAGSVTAAGELGKLGHAQSGRFGERGNAPLPGSGGYAHGASDAVGRMAVTGSERHDGRGTAGTAGTAGSGWPDAAGYSSPVDRLADADSSRSGTCGASVSRAYNGGRSEDSTRAIGSGEHGRPGLVNGFWRAADWLHCRDGKWRPVEPGTQPLAHGMPRSMGDLSPELQRLASLAGLSKASLKRAKQFRVGSLRGYGNAINAMAAQTFIESILEQS